MNNFKLQGEIARGNYRGAYDTDKIEMNAMATYLEAMWFITGEKYADAYKGGAFGSIKPINDFDLDKNKFGAWEIGLRAETYRVDDIIATSGAAGNAAMTFGSRLQGSASCTTDSADARARTTNEINASCEAKATTITAGLKWILNPNAMVKLNYSKTNFGHEWEYYDLNDSKRIKTEDLLMVRTQFMF
jgi:phosphate-selective porin OprO/OprP